MSPLKRTIWRFYGETMTISQFPTTQDVNCMENKPEADYSTMCTVNDNLGDSTAKIGELCKNTVVTPTNVRKAYVFSTCSIKTVTAILDEQTSNISMNDIGTIKKAVENTTDGQKKWEKVHDFWFSGIPEDAVEAYKAGGWVDFQAELIGLTEDDGGREHRMYVRPTKANLISELLGDPDAMCLDSARRSVLTRQFQRLFKKKQVKELFVGGRFRSKWPPAGSKKLKPWSQEFLEERLKTNPEAYRVITTAVKDVLEDMTDADRYEISHALFLAGIDGEETSHEPLRKWLETE